MPSWKLFEDQDAAYRESVMPSNIRARVSVEQAARFGWERYVGIDGARIGMRTFGESAPLQKLVKKFGFTVDAVVAAALEQAGKQKN
jgi:transketolase